MNEKIKDTIAAIATAPGRGSVGIVRISGPVVPLLGKAITDQNLTPRYAHYGNFYHPKTRTLIDEGLAIRFTAPNSFTGEDVLELQGHGGPVVMDQLLQAVLSHSKVRLAKPGEFTERAFLNDKLDLLQAEAIADLIDASNEQSARNAIHSLQGAFSDKIHTLVEELTQLRLYIEAAIDFPEEEIDFLQDQQLRNGMATLLEKINSVIKQAKQGVILREGMTLVIVGKPNAGKSSLMNALAGRESAIVTNIPGTTRDLLREHIQLGSMPLHIIDTAGIRADGDAVEQIGMDRAWEEMAKADRILLLVDSNEPLKSLDNKVQLKSLIPQFDNEKSMNDIDLSRITLVFNKIDLLPDKSDLNVFPELPTYYISAKTGMGLQALIEHLQQVMGYRQANEGGFTARRRHLEALNESLINIEHGQTQLKLGNGELAAEELRLAQRSLGTITGEVSADDLLGKIFSSFCIGK